MTPLSYKKPSPYEEQKLRCIGRGVDASAYITPDKQVYKKIWLKHQILEVSELLLIVEPTCVAKVFDFGVEEKVTPDFGRRCTEKNCPCSFGKRSQRREQYIWLLQEYCGDKDPAEWCYQWDTFTIFHEYERIRWTDVQKRFIEEIFDLYDKYQLNVSDLHPGNVRFHEGRLKIIDFGHFWIGK